MEYLGLALIVTAHLAGLAVVVWRFARDAHFDLGWMRPGTGGGGPDRGDGPPSPAIPPRGGTGVPLLDAEQGRRLREPHRPSPLRPERRRVVEPGERPRVPA